MTMVQHVGPHIIAQGSAVSCPPPRGVLGSQLCRWGGGWLNNFEGLKDAHAR